MRTAAMILGLSLGLLSARPAAAVEPWSDPDPAGPPQRLSLGASTGFRGGAEYRANAVAVRPLDLNGTRDRNFSTLEHRLRLDAGLDYDDKVRLVTSWDVLDGVLWGDNGTLGVAPEPSSGATVSTTNPNIAAACIQRRGNDPATEPSSYHFGLCETDPVFVRRLYGDIITPVGLIRIGRQAFTEGASIAVNDGDGRRNRFGFARRGNSADRILFATKPLEAFKPKELRDKSETKGTFLILAYDRLVTDDPQRFKDDLHGFVTAIRWLQPEHALGSDAEVRLFHAYRWSRANETGIHAVGMRAMSKFGDIHAGVESTVIAGSTREVGEAFRVITNDPAVDQRVTQFGARGVVRYDKSFYSLYLEADYASGDSDPQTRTPLTQFRFSEDTNVGLLLFKHALAYQTGRAAAAGVELLKNLNAPSYPLEAIATRGSFANAFAIFPQVDLHPVENLLLRGGVLMAWAPAKVVDPIASLQKRDGVAIEDDLVNFAGGPPGRYYGTELDLRVQYRMFEHFAADLEGAVLFPGSALQDVNGDAARSFLVQGRGTFYF
ncbi:MAG: alginate export family protein [Labilithrix sp.]|nr:alginate export family protein [Labilithrix sp.]